MAVFAFGETLMQPTIPAISNDLAADHTRGRYNAINAAAFQGGAILGPIAAGFLLEHGLAQRLHRGDGARLPLASASWRWRSSGGSRPRPTASRCPTRRSARERSAARSGRRQIRRRNLGLGA